MIMFIGIGEAASVIGVAISTLRRWELEKKFVADFRTCGGHRRYSLARIQGSFFKQAIEATSTTLINKKTYAYARVSSHDQKLDLKRQENRLALHCQNNNWEFEVISDLGSGINYQKKGLNKLLKLMVTGSISRLVLTHKDRLLRFGSPLLFKLCEYFGVEVVVLEQQLANDLEKELVADVIEIMTVFTAKMYGKRSHQNKLKHAELKHG